MKANQEQFIYVLKPVPALRVEANWTPEDQAVTAKHFAYLEKLKGEGRLILAGKTAGLDEKTFGIVIIVAASMAEAQAMMEQDPAVAGGIMTAELFSYKIGLMRS